MKFKNSLTAILMFATPAMLAASTLEEAWLTPASTLEGVRATGQAAGAVPVIINAAPPQPKTILFDPVVSYEGQERSVVLTRHFSERELTTTIQTPILEVVRQKIITYKLETYEDINCDYAAGDGRGDWKGFYEAPNYEKAARLAEAVKGLGETTAQCVVDSRALSSKPRTWNAFESAMAEADAYCQEEGHYGVYSRVIVQYGGENAAQLGYAGGEECTATKTQIWVPVEENLVKKKDTGRTAQSQVLLIFDNAPLLPSETESFTITFDGQKTWVQTSSPYNQYTWVSQKDSSNAVTFQAAGHRQQVTPGNSLTLQVFSGSSGPELWLTDQDYRAGLDQDNAQTMVSITIKKDGWGPFNSVVGKTQVYLTEGKAKVMLAPKMRGLKPGEAYFVECQLTRLGSRFNNERPSSAKPTQKYKF
ncbi:MAG: hypothetical protein HY547_02930 [Elusimicrobia bacterium]|nr:hypothetical protein [Elusimicrobiota bacterium]